MLRSVVNKSISEAIVFFKKNNFTLPTFAHFTPNDWKENVKNYSEAIETRLGWDVTDFGLNNFSKFGRTIFTLRNGKIGSKTFPKSYAQKIMHLKENQKSPIHLHKNKMEDIINFTGGIIAIRFWKSDNKSLKLKRNINLHVSEKKTRIIEGKVLLIKPGNSVCVIPGTYHQFWAKKGFGHVLSMEISSVNDDLKDNVWLKKAERFPKILDDEPKQHLLCSEYNNI